MSQSELTKMGIALGILYGVYKFAPQQQVKAMALGVAGIIIAKQVPILRDQV